MNGFFCSSTLLRVERSVALKHLSIRAGGPSWQSSTHPNSSRLMDFDETLVKYRLTHFDSDSYFIKNDLIDRFFALIRDRSLDQDGKNSNQNFDGIFGFRTINVTLNQFSNHLLDQYNLQLNFIKNNHTADKSMWFRF